MNFLDGRIPMKFWRNVMPEPNSGCWLWLRYTMRTGYGVQKRRAPHSGSALTHRYTYEVARGPLPTNTEIDHRCRERSCCNPAHMEAVSHRVNVLRGDAKKTHCKNGHRLAGANLAKTAKGARCRACLNADSRERKRRAYVPRKRKRKALCMRGHVKRDNGKRLVCDECVRQCNRDAEGAM